MTREASGHRRVYAGSVRRGQRRRAFAALGRAPCDHLRRLRPAALRVVDLSRLATIRGRGGLEPAGPGLAVGSVAASRLARDIAVLAVACDGILRLRAQKRTSHGGSEE